MGPNHRSSELDPAAGIEGRYYRKSGLLAAWLSHIRRYIEEGACDFDATLAATIALCLADFGRPEPARPFCVYPQIRLL